MNEQQQVPTSEVLYRAADLIEERGWVRGPRGWGQGENSGLCLEGGIFAALGVDVGTAGGFAHQYDDMLKCPAYTAVHTYLSLRDDTELWEWNDARGTAAEVIEVLRAAAVIEAARERSAADERAASAAVQS